MTDDMLESLRAWASTHAPAGCLRAKQVLALLDALDEQKALNLALAERCAGQSELLTRRAAASPPPTDREQP